MTEYVGSTLCTRVCPDVIFYVGCPHTLPSCVWGHFSVPRGEIGGRAEAVTGQAWPQIQPRGGLDVTNLNGAKPSWGSG